MYAKVYQVHKAMWQTILKYGFIFIVIKIKVKQLKIKTGWRCPNFYGLNLLIRRFLNSLTTNLQKNSRSWTNKRTAEDQINWGWNRKPKISLQIFCNLSFFTSNLTNSTTHKMFPIKGEKR